MVERPPKSLGVSWFETDAGEFFIDCIWSPALVLTMIVGVAVLVTWLLS